jgi:hypothetical protein
MGRGTVIWLQGQAVLSRRQFLGALAASVATKPLEAIAGPRSHLWTPPSPEIDWHYGRAYSLAVRTNLRVLDLPDPPVRRDPPVAPPIDLSAMGRLLRQRFPDLAAHFAFEYYPWYGTNPWRHWNQWDRMPPVDIAVTSVPALGPYDSRDPKVIERHARWIADTGVGGINVSWWGQGSYEDQAVPVLMDVMHDHGLKVTFHLEPYSDGRTERYADDIRYLIAQYGDKRGWDAMLVLRDANGDEGPVFKSFATILPQTSTDCHGRTSPVSLWRPDSVWRQQTDTVRTTFGRDFDHVHLLADSGALDRVRVAGFDGIAIYDSYLRPPQWPALARSCREFQLLFSFNINDGFDGIAQRNVPAGSCYHPPPFEPPAVLDFESPVDLEWAKLYAERRIDDSMGTTLGLQTDSSLTDSGSGFFMVFINSFNEWHEGTAFEPMKNRMDLTPEELALDYHNPMRGDYRLSYLTARLAAVLQTN